MGCAVVGVRCVVGWQTVQTYTAEYCFTGELQAVAEMLKPRMMKREAARRREATTRVTLRGVLRR